jgi:6-phosphogluconolactonase (cycloisomerase 2 family)
LTLEDRVAGWAEDNKSVYTYRRHEFPLNVYKIDLRSGESRLLKQFTLPDVAAVGNFSVNITPDGRYYACDYGQFLSDLYVLKGLGK